MATHVFVKVPEPDTSKGEEARRVPVPISEGVSAGGAMLIAEPGYIYRLPWSTYTRRRIATNDLALTTATGGKAANEVEADASGFVRITPEGTVDADQRTDEVIAKEAELATARASAKHTPALEHGPALSKFDTTDAKGKV